MQKITNIINIICSALIAVMSLAPSPIVHKKYKRNNKRYDTVYIYTSDDSIAK